MGDVFYFLFFKTRSKLFSSSCAIVYRSVHVGSDYLKSHTVESHKQLQTLGETKKELKGLSISQQSDKATTFNLQFLGNNTEKCVRHEHRTVNVMGQNDLNFALKLLPKKIWSLIRIPGPVLKRYVIINVTVLVKSLVKSWSRPGPESRECLCCKLFL